MYKLRIESLGNMWDLIDVNYDGEKLINWDYFVHEPRQASCKLFFDEILYNAIKDSDNVLKASFQEDGDNLGVMRYKCQIINRITTSVEFTGYIDISISTDYKTMDLKLWDAIKIVSEMAEKIKVLQGNAEMVLFEDYYDKIQFDINNYLNLDESINLNFPEKVWDIEDGLNKIFEVAIPLIYGDLDGNLFFRTDTNNTSTVLNQLIKIDIIKPDDSDKGTFGIRYTNYYNVSREDGLPTTDNMNNVKKITANLSVANLGGGKSEEENQEDLNDAISGAFIENIDVSSHISVDNILDVNEEELAEVIDNDRWDIFSYVGANVSSSNIVTNQANRYKLVSTNTAWSPLSIYNETRIYYAYTSNQQKVQSGSFDFFDNYPASRIFLRYLPGYVYQPRIEGWSSSASITSYPQAYRTRNFKGRDTFCAIEGMTYKDLFGAYLFFNDKQMVADNNGVVQFRNVEWQNDSGVIEISPDDTKLSIQIKFLKKQNPEALDKIIAPDNTVNLEVLNNAVNTYYGYVWNKVNSEYSIEIFKTSRVPDLEIGDIIGIRLQEAEIEINSDPFVRITELKLENNVYSIKGVDV